MMQPREHRMDVFQQPGSYTVRCSCGFRQGIPAQNVLARAAKIRKYLRQHAIAASIETMARSLTSHLEAH